MGNLSLDPRVLGYRGGALAARMLPRPAVRPVAAVLGAVGAQAMADRRFVAERNLRRVHGSDLSGLALRRAVNATFDSYARYWLESFRLPGTSPATLAAGWRVEGFFEHVGAARRAGNGVILALPHLGGWEWAAFWLAEVQGTPVTAVVEVVEPPELAEWFGSLRRSIGINVVPLGPSAGIESIRALRENHVLCLLCDRDVGGGGIDVEFFGERTTLPGGPATLALRSGAPLCPAAVYFEGDRRFGLVQPPLDLSRHGRLRADVERVTQDLAGELEYLIRRAPEQWHLLQPNWPSDHAALTSRS